MMQLMKVLALTTTRNKSLALLEFIWTGCLLYLEYMYFFVSVVLCCNIVCVVVVYQIQCSLLHCDVVILLSHGHFFNV